MSDKLVLYEVNNRVGYITLNRPEKRNALNAGFVKEIKTVFKQAEADVSCKVIVLRANGDAFCAGADLGYLQSLQTNTYEENLADSQHLMELFRMIHLSSKVVIAQVNGPAMAGGCGLAGVCDFSFTTPESTFAYTEVKIGFIPAIVMVFLVRKIGEGKARELLLTGDVIDATKAQQMGLINYVESAATLSERVQSFAERLCKTASGQSLKLVKEMLAGVQDRTLEEALLYAATMNANARATEDCKRGISAFLNKEKLSW
ncbi:MAG: enoyl-CoA hydratase/isomerase family protein [Bacteroidia bacterium]|nr:enoyl-CoA hydratase/isomerase family protein [Bacteroidia bacterium]MBP7262127.1 enoyl-CoA hydratase/isomerase family protein [Bacteroidia bacterium]MBP9725516.1 enoyl-CoA hydratase/isomerase family protein [Bacteroidia bacterium]